MSTMQHLSTIIREFWQERVLGRQDQDASQTPKRHAALDISQFPPQALGAGAYLRQLVEEDLPELVALEELCYDGFLAWTLKDFRTDFRYNLYAIYWVLEIDGHIQGLISGRCQQKTAHISHLFIHPRFRRQGYARRLVQRWCRCVSQIGSRRVTLEVRATNQAAQSLYQGLGFEIERLVPNRRCRHGQQTLSGGALHRRPATRGLPSGHY